MNVRDKVAIVTSASTGIGLAAARLIANKGAKLALAARSHDKFQELRKGPLIAMQKVILLANASTGRRAHLQHQLHGIQELFSPHRRVRLNKIRPQRALQSLFWDLSTVLKP
jgi:NAD(P)-dependent dehydrogenase (short-subunit alcohol dehydrogenase family)